MAYCTGVQVADEFNGVTFAATTNPTDTTVDRWIAEADATIDAYVGLRFEVPVVDASALLILRQIALLLVSARVRRRLNRTGPEGETAKVKVTDSHDQAMKMLKDISMGKMELGAAVPRNSDLGVKSFTQGLDCPHTFKKNCDQW